MGKHKCSCDSDEEYLYKIVRRPERRFKSNKYRKEYYDSDNL